METPTDQSPLSLDNSVSVLNCQMVQVPISAISSFAQPQVPGMGLGYSKYAVGRGIQIFVMVDSAYIQSTSA